LRKRSWKRLSRRDILRAPMFSFVDEKWRTPGGRKTSYYILNTPDWVNVIALDGRKQVVMIREYRCGVARRVLELPGGCTEARDRGPLGAAKRELLEETGFTARKWQYLGFINPNPAFQNNRNHTFLALGAHPSAPQSLDEGEEISVVRIPLRRISGLIKTGKLTHALVICAFHLFFSSREGRKMLGKDTAG